MNTKDVDRIVRELNRIAQTLESMVENSCKCKDNPYCVNVSDDTMSKLIAKIPFDSGIIPNS